MEFLSNIEIGLLTALTPTNLLYCLFGVVIGTVIGVLPGIGAVATIAMLLPMTFGLPAATGIIMLAGIYYGAQYGGSTTAILVNLPGETSSVVTVLDGHQMARKGRAGAALATAAIGSFVAGTLGTLLIAVFSPTLAKFALFFGPAEQAMLVILGLIMAVVLASGSLLKAFGMLLTGLLLGLVGVDLSSGVHRFTFGVSDLAEGIDFVFVAMGLFGVAEVIRNLENQHLREVLVKKISGFYLSKDDCRRIIGPILRGTGIGTLLGLLPGSGATLAAFAAYAVEKKISKGPVPFGEGAIEGVAAPESANNAGAQSSFIPMLTLGIPATPVMALMIGVLIIQGIQPGPMVLTRQPDLFWGLIVSMWIGNFFLLILNLPMIGIWIRLLSIPYHLLFAIVLVFCSIGVLSINNSTFDVYGMAVFGLAGYLLLKMDCEPAPLLLGFVLGPMLEEHVRRAMLLARGDATVFLIRPLSAVMLVMAVAALVVVLAPAIRATRDKAFKEEA